MSFAVKTDRFWHRVRPALFFLLVLGALHLASHLTGFGDWLRGNASAIVVVRVVAVTIFGGGALLLLWGGRSDPECRTITMRLSMAFALFLASANVALLIGGESYFDQYFSE